MNITHCGLACNNLANNPSGMSDISMTITIKIIISAVLTSTIIYKINVLSNQSVSSHQNKLKFATYSMLQTIAVFFHLHIPNS